MLSQDKNELLCRVEGDAPMGKLLRRYWQPITGASEFDTRETKAVRLFGENLVLYKDKSGNYGLVDRHCTHRRADLQHGFIEREGIRCNYHGWTFNHKGECVERPYEETVNPDDQGKKNCAIKAYPVKEAGGILWTYMGPADKQPELPVWEPFNWKNGFKQIVTSTINCNWLAPTENNIDPVHFEFTHEMEALRLKGTTGVIPKHTKLQFEEFEYGFMYKRVRENTGEDHPLWTVGRCALYPNVFFLGDHFEWRVPVDDTHMLSVSWFFLPVPAEQQPYEQATIPSWEGPVYDEQGRMINTHVMNQDFITWEGQGQIADRSKEHLGASDRGIVMLRRRFFEDLEAIAEGRDPKGLIRDAAAASDVVLPVAYREELMHPIPKSEYVKTSFARYMKDFVLCAGQPWAVRQQTADALGAVLGEDGIARFE